MMPNTRIAPVLLSLFVAAPLSADDSAVQPNRVPVTRPEMKQALEDLKSRAPRIPAPALTAEEQEKLGDRAKSLEGVLRLRYLPHEAQGVRSQESDPNMSLTYEFKTMMFWIVARVNNCHY